MQKLPLVLLIFYCNVKYGSFNHRKYDLPYFSDIIDINAL